MQTTRSRRAIAARTLLVLTALALLMPMGAAADAGSPTGPTNLYGVFLPYISTVGNSTCSPLYLDDFSNPASGWPTLNDDEQQLGYINNEYRIIAKAYNVQPVALSPYSASDYAVAVSTRPLVAGASSHGLLFGYSAARYTGYSFEIYSEDGFWEIWRRDNLNDWTLLSFDHSDSIKKGLAVNRLKVVRQGDSIAVYANGDLIKTVTDGKYVGAGGIGVLLSSYDDDPYEVRYDDFTVYPLPCGASAAGLP